MKKVLVFDEQGNYKEDKIVDDNYQSLANEFLCEITDVISFYSPKLVKGQVVEGLSQTEIDVLQRLPKTPTTEDRLSAVEDTLTMMLGL